MVKGSEHIIEGFLFEETVHFLHRFLIGMDFRLDSVEDLDTAGGSVFASFGDEFAVGWNIVPAHPDAGLGKTLSGHGDVAGEGYQGNAVPGR